MKNMFKCVKRVGIMYHDSLAVIYTNDFFLNGSILRMNS